MLSKAVDMASKSRLLVLHLVLLAVLASARRPLTFNRYHTCQGSSSTKMDTNRNTKVNGRDWNSIVKTNNIGNGIDGRKINAGLSMGILPIPIPGADAGFQFQIGPIGFGSNWTFGLSPPGSVISYRQPIVVSPYLQPLSTPSSSSSAATAASSYPAPHQQQPIVLKPVPKYYYPFHRVSFERYGEKPSGHFHQGTNKMQYPYSEHK